MNLMTELCSNVSLGIPRLLTLIIGRKHSRKSVDFAIINAIVFSYGIKKFKILHTLINSINYLIIIQSSSKKNLKLIIQ